ncbi:hypothetical protein A4G26_24990 [Mycobacterium kansasii]|uniref:Uncharacterized protein n=1 Tax=Mycobacterium innocens TaxID=2341083 RepID=A0A498Q8V6_9MYCO|nr:hypothetical protein A4G26_24990 [Mycobacterium kansasii]VBA41163.1 hypothetical protein LAUMK13_03421 [Mycobacterium innocens]
MCADRSGDHALVFTANVDGLEIEGCDVIHTRPDGLIDEITVTLRPLRQSACSPRRCARSQRVRDNVFGVCGHRP